MRLIDDSVLNRFRGAGLCEWCGRPVSWRDPHHIHSGAAGRVDIPGNIAALCVPFAGGDNCHRQFHDGHILRADLLAVTAAREGCTQADIEHDVYLIRRMPKETPLADVFRQLRSVRVRWTPRPHGLARRKPLRSRMSDKVFHSVSPCRRCLKSTVQYLDTKLKRRICQECAGDPNVSKEDDEIARLRAVLDDIASDAAAFAGRSIHEWTGAAVRKAFGEIRDRARKGLDP